MLFWGSLYLVFGVIYASNVIYNLCNDKSDPKESCAISKILRHRARLHAMLFAFFSIVWLPRSLHEIIRSGKY